MVGSLPSEPGTCCHIPKVRKGRVCPWCAYPGVPSGSAIDLSTLKLTFAFSSLTLLPFLTTESNHTPILFQQSSQSIVFSMPLATFLLLCIWMILYFFLPFIDVTMSMYAIINYLAQILLCEQLSLSFHPFLFKFKLIPHFDLRIRVRLASFLRYSTNCIVFAWFFFYFFPILRSKQSKSIRRNSPLRILWSDGNRFPVVCYVTYPIDN